MYCAATGTTIQESRRFAHNLPRAAALTAAEPLVSPSQQAKTDLEPQSALYSSVVPKWHPVWNDHIIFNGTGWLSTCPSDTEEYSEGSSSSSSKGWPKGTWLHPKVPTTSPSAGSSSSSSSRLPYGNGLMLPHSAYVQRMIWEHQHPQDCEKAKFVLYRDPGPGKTQLGTRLS